jgi:glycosyltransferase involved in cell wall biosynthesis
VSINDDSELQDEIGSPSPASKNKRVKSSSPEVAVPVSVVVLSKDEPALATTLDLLRPQCVALGAECIVVDASNGRLDYIRDDHPWVRWIHYSGPFWRSSTIPHQRNVGCRAAAGEVIAFCDCGGEPQVDWLKSLTDPIISGQRTLVCGPIFAKGASGVFPVMNDFADDEILPSAPTGNMAFLKSVFHQVNGFDERLYYGSDFDFVWRCADAQNPCHQVRAAAMVMDWGSASQTFRRSWRYGRGWTRLFKLHPERRDWMVRNSPERVAYPLWILLGPPLIIASRRSKFRWLPAAWLGFLAIPYWRHRKYPSPRAVVADHIIGGVSVLDEASRQLVGEVAPIVFLPHDETPYLRLLADALKEQGVPVSYWRGPTKSETLNILLGPLWMAILAWRGARVIHIHWTYGFSRSSGPVGGRLARMWFDVFLRVAHRLGVKIVWTAHNILPHEPVFDDDIAARRVLVERCDAVIALSVHGAEEVSARFGASNVTIVPHGPLGLPASKVGREVGREILGIGERPCFSFFGNLRPYKGVETLIGAAKLIGPDVAVRIIGRGEPKYVDELERKILVANAAGADIRLEARWQSESELADYLAASDFCVFPFDHAENSGSVLLALTTGVPVIIPDLPSLGHLSNPGVLYYDSADPVFALSDTMKAAASLSDLKRIELGDAGREWTSCFEWAEIAEQTAKVYAQAMLSK